MPRLYVAWLVLLLTLSACGSPTPPRPTASRLETAYPGSSPPVAGTDLPRFAVIPTPSAPDRSTITGVLLKDPSSPQPVLGVVLYLAEIIPESRGTPWLAGFERTASPRTQTDGAGRFVFADVPPQEYALVLDRVYEAFLLTDPEDGGDFIFEPQSGQVLDLGDLVYVSLPGDQPGP